MAQRFKQPPVTLSLAAVAAVLLVVVVVAFVIPALNPTADGPGPAHPGEPGSYLFCLWNVENLFDDKDDHRKGPGDKEFDPWLANNPEMLKLKLDKLTEALLRMNDRRGPDVLALIEVESLRAAELLREALNQKLDKKELHYNYVVMKELTAGRHIAPAVISRLPLKGEGQLVGSRMRILKTQVELNGHALTLLVGHWTSRLDKGDDRRALYADKMYGEFRRAFTADENADVLLCGDFNDTPDDDSVVKHLHSSGDAEAVKAARDTPLLFNLFAGKDPKEYGTHYYSGKWYIFDQILVSRGLLDRAGWWCDPATARPFKTGLTKEADKKGRPWRFGSEREKGARGYSDHFPVTVRLSVAGK